MALLEIENLSVNLPARHGLVHAVRHVSFTLRAGATLGIVGESGSGKSMTAMAIMGLLADGARVSGSIRLNGRDLLKLSDRQMCKVRGKEIAMVFQEPMTSLNPLYTIGRQVADPLLRHLRMTGAAAREETVRLLQRVGIGDAVARLDQYPHQLSGGQRQRVMIAMALSCQPALLIADEPTTALDVTIQRQILELVDEIVDETGMALILISHDLGVVGEVVDDVLVMYGGTVVERGPTEALFRDISHPYTRGLFAAMPKLGQGPAVRLQTIPGNVPDLTDVPDGCVFADRCPIAIDACRLTAPAFVPIGPGHQAACRRVGESAAAPA